MSKDDRPYRDLERDALRALAERTLLDPHASRDQVQAAEARLLTPRFDDVQASIKSMSATQLALLTRGVELIREACGSRPRETSDVTGSDVTVEKSQVT